MQSDNSGQLNPQWIEFALLALVVWFWWLAFTGRVGVSLGAILTPGGLEEA